MSHSTFCDIPAGRIAYSRRGTGRPLVLLHPIGVDRSWWDEYVEHWAASYDVVAIDIRGHGGSSLVTAPITLADHATDVAAVLRHERLTGATLIGVSMGGMIAQRVAIQFPELVGALILCGTAGGFPDEVRPRILVRGDMSRRGSMSEVIDDTITRWFAADTPRPDLVQKCRERLAADDWYSWSANWQAISLLEHSASGIAEDRRRAAEQPLRRHSGRGAFWSVRHARSFCNGIRRFPVDPRSMK
jgi:3-oxoadipate enol-lactonase